VPARRFFVQGVRAVGERIAIDGADARKIVAVLRSRDGDAIELVDSAGTRFDARLEIEGAKVIAVPIAAQPPPASESRLRVDVAQAVPKGQKMDFVVEKATELGARAILPFTSERSVVQGTVSSKVERWRRLAKSAAQQCGRAEIPGVEPVAPFEEILERFEGYDVVLFPWELAEAVPLRESLPPLLERASRALIVIGPEGGFSHAEADAAQERGARLVWLGPRILRTETAAMVLLSILEYV
jgi:16S rRNA (uracil1498-N3)-methyltransferase